MPRGPAAAGQMPQPRRGEESSVAASVFSAAVCISCFCSLWDKVHHDVDLQSADVCESGLRGFLRGAISELELVGLLQKYSHESSPCLVQEKMVRFLLHRFCAFQPRSVPNVLRNTHVKQNILCKC